MPITIIAAVSRNDVIGLNGDLPWDIPEDRKRFKDLTKGHAVVMGSGTYESILRRLGKPLSYRVNIVVTSRDDLDDDRITIAHSIGEAFDCAQQAIPDKDICVIGGESIYRQSLPYADKMEITRVEGNFPGNSFFPEIDRNIWEMYLLQLKKTMGEKSLKYNFETWRRK